MYSYINRSLNDAEMSVFTLMNEFSKMDKAQIKQQKITFTG